MSLLANASGKEEVRETGSKRGVRALGPNIKPFFCVFLPLPFSANSLEHQTALARLWRTALRLREGTGWGAYCVCAGSYPSLPYGPKLALSHDAEHFTFP